MTKCSKRDLNASSVNFSASNRKIFTWISYLTLKQQNPIILCCFTSSTYIFFFFLIVLIETSHGINDILCEKTHLTQSGKITNGFFSYLLHIFPVTSINKAQIFWNTFIYLVRHVEMKQFPPRTAAPVSSQTHELCKCTQTLHVFVNSPSSCCIPSFEEWRAFWKINCWYSWMNLEMRDSAEPALLQSKRKLCTMKPWNHNISQTNSP